MREIKFRAWDRCNERMVEPRNILKICMSRLNQEPYLIVYLKKWMNPNRGIKEIDKCYTNEFELMQYTGLKDRNGVAIYEGDICKWYIDKGNNYRVVKIKYMKGDSSFTGTYVDEWGGLNCISLINANVGYEVIGNIYENPELIEL